ncbi:hypothetical protein C8R43DRAFT_622052 [Mycena crocata]|nr:hypothetical protein C8R43DRAFT_622052 [Mycena crocata]
MDTNANTHLQATTPFPPTNAANQRICRQCGLPGRYKEGKCVEKWGPGPLGPGTVCDRCRKKMKRVERRGTLEQQLQQTQSAAAASAAAPTSSGSFRSTPVHRSDTLPSATAYREREPAQESSMRSSLAASPSHAAPAAPTHATPTPTPAAGRVIKNRLTPAPAAVVGPGPGAAGGAPGLLPPLRTHSPMEVDDEDLDADAEAEVDEIDAEADAEGAGDAEGEDAEGEGDPEADLLEAVDAAEAASNSTGSGGKRMKSEE